MQKLIERGLVIEARVYQRHLLLIIINVVASNFLAEFVERLIRSIIG